MLTSYSKLQMRRCIPTLKVCRAYLVYVLSQCLFAHNQSLSIVWLRFLCLIYSLKRAKFIPQEHMIPFICVLSRNNSLNTSFLRKIGEPCGLS